MIPFLHRIAAIFNEKFGTQLYKHTFVFPNRRAGVFFQKYLAEIAGKPLFSPGIITIQELFQSLSDYQMADRIEMLVMLYRHYADISGSDDSFDDFLYWGEMLLNDFNDVDKHLADAEQVFRNVKDLKSLDGDMSYLTPLQIAAIRRFWESFMPVEDNETKKKFQETWQILHELYTRFRAELHEKGEAYEGMMFRAVAAKARANENVNLGFSGIVFVGLNALTPAEAVLLEYLKNTGVADFYWDYESPLVRDEDNRASLWVKENLSRFPSKLPFENSEEAGKRPVIEVIGIPSGVGQAKHVTRILSHLLETGATSPDEAINTAVVLPDENLLLPVLYSIPQEFGKINVTMGYGLSHASVASLVDHIADLQRNVRKQGEGENVFYYKTVLAVLNHPLISVCTAEEAAELKEYILRQNRIVVTGSEIPRQKLLQLIFRPVSGVGEVSDYLKEILEQVYRDITNEQHRDDALRADARPLDLEREFIVQYYKSIIRLQDTLREAKPLTTDTYFRLLKRLVQGISVPFSGEPLSGLQIMGVLETRVLDFDNLILLSMNEGIFPLKKPTNSFIPYTLRKGFGLPTYEHQDSTYAYHFYRMISRAKRVFMLYDTRAEELQSGEVSRYFYQLKYLYGDAFDIRERVAGYDVSAPKILPVSVAKTPDVMRKLDKFRAGGDASLSASLINNYINCPLQFYFTAVEGLSEEDEVKEFIEADVFGSILHRLMETVYDRYRGQTVTPDVLAEITKNDAYLTEMIEKAFARYYFKDENNPKPLQGQHYLIGEILRDYVKQTLRVDKQFSPFQYVGSEYRFDTHYSVNDSLVVNFKGSIDRIDRIGNTYRVIDYKTGSGATDFKSVEQLFDASKNNRPYQILQVFVYALFYLKQDSDKTISPAIYYLRSLFKNFNPVISYGNQPVTDISVYMEEFTDRFNACLTDIFNPEIPFSQTLNEKNCEWCAFKDVCGR